MTYIVTYRAARKLWERVIDAPDAEAAIRELRETQHAWASPISSIVEVRKEYAR